MERLTQRAHILSIMQGNNLLLLLFLCAVTRCFAWTSLTPPAGNSVSLKTKTLNGVEYYRCVEDNWIPESANAVLVDLNDPTQRIGSYSWIKKARYPQHAGTWHLFNSPGVYAESGYKSSRVTGEKVFIEHAPSPHGMPDFLALAVNHEYQGTASKMSYITRMSTDQRATINDAHCEYEKQLIQHPFSAEFQFWKQDLVPPSMPSELAVTSDRLIQGFFGKGFVTYVYDGQKWNQKNIAAQLYDVPGGVKKGSHYNSEGGTSYWRFDDPNGFELTGKSACNHVQMDPNALPWTVNVVSSSSSKSSMFGPYSIVQMVSTTGGLPPPANPTLKCKAGQIWESSFTAIYWIYCRSSS